LEVNVAVDHFLGERSSSSLSLGIGLREADGLEFCARAFGFSRSGKVRTSLARSAILTHPWQGWASTPSHCARKAHFEERFDLAYGSGAEGPVPHWLRRRT
jgi:hypothetical protein